MPDIKPTYVARSIEKDSGDRPGENVQVELFRLLGNEEQRIGGYVRDLGTAARTFAPFRKGGRDFALYSPSYTCTRVMALPSCDDLGGESPNSDGFCPMEYYIPDETRVGDLAGSIGFIYGCRWAGPFQIQFLDLSNVEQGMIVRKDLLVPCIDLPVDKDRLPLSQYFEVGRQGDEVHLHLRCELTMHIEFAKDSPVVAPF